MSMVDFLIAPRMQRVLAALLVNPNREFSYNELIEVSQAGRNGGRETIQRLAEGGVVLERRLANQRRFRANPAFPLYAELRAICAKSFGMTECIKTMLEPMAPSIKLAFVFGSVAEGRDHADSDIDLLVVGDVDVLELSAAASAAEAELGRPVHLSAYGSDEWEHLLQTDKVMMRIADGPKLMVIGNGH